MTDAWILYLLFYAFACYLIATWGAKKKIGFGDALLLSILLSPVIGALFVLNSAPKPDQEPWKKEQIPDGYAQEIRIQYSRLLRDFHDGKISKEEFERRKAGLLAKKS